MKTNLYKIRFTVSTNTKTRCDLQSPGRIFRVSLCCCSNFSPMLLIKHNLPPVSHQFQSSAVSKNKKLATPFFWFVCHMGKRNLKNSKYNQGQALIWWTVVIVCRSNLSEIMKSFSNCDRHQSSRHECIISMVINVSRWNRIWLSCSDRHRQAGMHNTRTL